MLCNLLKGNRKSNRLLIFIHGSACNLTFLKQLADLMPDYDRMLVNLPGHWEDKDGELSYENYKKSVRDIIELFSNREIVLIGHSLGGTLALDIASEHHLNIKRVVSLSGTARYPELDEKLLELAEQGKMDFDYLAQYADIENADVRKAMSCMESEAVAAKDLVIDSQVNIAYRLEHIYVPVLLCIGTEDKLALPKYADEVLAKIRYNISIMKGEGYKHMYCIADKENVVKRIKEFIVEGR